MNEEVVQESDIPQGYRSTYDKAVAAVKMNNHGYAVELLLAVVKDIPGFLNGRKLLRRASVQAFSGKKKILDTTAVKLRKPQATLKKDPVAALSEIEDILKEDPLNSAANQVLFEAANAASMPQTASFALETALQGKPGDTKIGHRLAEYLLAHDDPERAIQIYEHILKHDHTDGDARKGVTNANARLSMKRQKWDEGGGGNFRDLLKNKDKAKQMEDMSRVGATREQIQEQIDHLMVEYSANQNDINVVRKMADLYERLEDWDQALAFYSWANQLSGGDSALETKVHRLQDKIEEYSIKRLRDELETNPSDPDAETKRAQIAELERAREEKLVTVSRERVERNPTDPQLRFELGTHLYASGHTREAIPELQRAKNNPHIRHKAMLMLARCYGASKMYDLALAQLKDAAVEMAIMDATKKEIVYEMGMMYDATGKKDDALECFKQIYSVDYGYHDVAARVEGAYAQH
ncbi:MAG TPA: tetratricopeptide repeat protein [Verrucomicrobiales bacterium]|jgi:tetratricopeptide (TPR) repeat protein|nr:tetratricopeptide repeat protein [Verrucomicrobiales bacterium]